MPMKLALVNANERRRWWNLNFNGDIHWTWQWLSSHDSRAFYCLQSSFAVWKTSLEEKRNHGSFFPGGSEGSLSLQFQLQASSTVRTLKFVQIPMMPELSFQQENKRLAWRMARHDMYIPRCAGALWEDKGQVLGIWWQVCDMLRIPRWPDWRVM